MAEQEVNLQYAYNSLLNRYMETVKELSYKDSLITSMQEKISELQDGSETVEDDAEDD